MPTATISIKKKGWKQGNRSGYVMDGQTETFYGLGNPLYEQVNEGDSVTVEYVDKGRFKDITKLIADSGPPPQGHNANGHANGDTKSRDMFVMGVVGRAMGSGKFGYGEIQMLTEHAKASWDKYMA